MDPINILLCVVIKDRTKIVDFPKVNPKVNKPGGCVDGSGARQFQNKTLDNRADALTFVIGKRRLPLPLIFLIKHSLVDFFEFWLKILCQK
jgi:hypothetical protein